MASAAVNKTADELKTEIAELYRQNREINERLNNRGRRLGRGGFLRPIGGRGRGKIRKADNDLEGPPAKKLSSAVVKVNGEAETSTRPGETRYNRRRDPGFYGYEGRSESPRVVPQVDDPKLEKRNRRMFGALLGTLEKFRKEEMSNSDAVNRRSDSLKKAVEKAQEESDKLRQQERESYTERRKRDLMLRAKISAKAEEKQTDLLFIDWEKHHERLATTFLQTKAEPRIYYLPVKHTERDKKQLEEQQKELEEWKVKCREELDEYQRSISEKYIAKAEADIEKVGKNRRRAPLDSEAAQKEDEEAAANEENEIEQDDHHQQEQGLEENDALVADVMEEEDDYRPEDDAPAAEVQ